MREHRTTMGGMIFALTLMSPEIMCRNIIEPPKKDVFIGGGRSKGEKKRAARERRMRGGY